MPAVSERAVLTLPVGSTSKEKARRSGSFPSHYQNARRISRSSVDGRS
uniref:Uncharacterized protein n=1 Tax=Anguilla anguilla TaxID=7936 RepID=A0A0E9WS27_ANGAN